MKPIDKVAQSLPELVICPHCKPIKAGTNYACMFEQMYTACYEDSEVTEYCTLEDWRGCGLNASSRR